mgnify:FL=1|jgi:toxin secretion/phage lysis holin|nr:MAG TPA: holin [Bacteriophage sp.]
MDLENLINTLNFSSIIWQIATPLIFSLCDVLTGFIQAIINNEVQSKVMREGLLHKSLIIIIVFLSFVASLTFNISLISKAVCIYVIVMETMSIVENLGKAGIKIEIIDKILKKEGSETDETK